jgi:hypothetical protein
VHSSVPFGAKITFIHSEIYRYPFGDSFSQQNAIFQKTITTDGRNLTNTDAKRASLTPISLASRDPNHGSSSSMPTVSSPRRFEGSPPKNLLRC